jgi:hypothetical protein
MMDWIEHFHEATKGMLVAHLCSPICLDNPCETILLMMVDLPCASLASGTMNSLRHIIIVFLQIA